MAEKSSAPREKSSRGNPGLKGVKMKFFFSCLGLGFICFVSFLLVLDNSIPEKDAGPLLLIPLFILLFVPIVGFLFAGRKGCSRERERNDLKALTKHFLNQAAVDERLTRLAQDFKSSCGIEIGLLQTGRPISDDAELQEMADMVKNRVAAAKKAYWSAHAAAKVCGFKVHSSYLDYLPKPEPASA